MGNMILDQLGAHQMSFKGLGIPELTPDVQKLVDSVHAEVGSRTIEPEAERGERLIGLLAPRAKGRLAPCAAYGC